MQKKVRTVIIVLSVLLTASVLTLIGTLLYNYFYPVSPTTVVVPDNLISPDSETGSDAFGQEQGNTGDQSAPEAKLPAEDETDSYTLPDYNAPAASADDGRTGQSGETAVALYLYNRDADENTPFRVTNMFPGDSETKYYCIRVSHKDDVTVRYHADIRAGYEKLAEVLKCRIVLLTTGETMYDGLMRDMPASLDHTLIAEASTTSELYYGITAYLDTGVGNDYQQKELIADFRWWVEEDEHLDDNPTAPKTGAAVTVCASVAVMSLFLIIIVGKRRSREEDDDAE